MLRFVGTVINVMYPIHADQLIIREEEPSEADVTPPQGFFARLYYNVLAWWGE